MYGFNRVFLMGYLGADPEPKTSKGGKAYVRMSLATHHTKRLENGETEAQTVWHHVTAWGRTADLCRLHLRRGSALAVEGTLSRYNVENEDGSNKSSVAIIAKQIHFIGRRPDKTDALNSISENHAPSEIPF